MKILQTVQKNLAMIGFAPHQQQNTNRTFSRIQTFVAVSSIFLHLQLVYTLSMEQKARKNIYVHLVYANSRRRNNHITYQSRR